MQAGPPAGGECPTCIAGFARLRENVILYGLATEPLRTLPPYNRAGQARQALTWPSGVRRLSIPGVYAWGVSRSQDLRLLLSEFLGRQNALFFQIGELLQPRHCHLG
jgi:hypothetical protein